MQWGSRATRKLSQEGPEGPASEGSEGQAAEAGRAGLGDTPGGICAPSAFSVLLWGVLPGKSTLKLPL